MTRDGVEVAREDVRLGPGEARPVTVEPALGEPGPHVLGIGATGDERVVVDVTPEPLRRELPGFGALAALLALCLFAIVGARRG